MDVIEQQMRAAIEAHEWNKIRLLGDEALIRDAKLELQNATDDADVKRLQNRLEFIRDRVAATNATDETVLETLSHHIDPNIRSFVASNPNTPVSVLENLAKDEDAQVRNRVVENTSVTVSLLKLLASDKDWRVRMEVTFNRNTPFEVVTQQLVFDSEAKVRSAAAMNIQLAPAIANMLAYDENEEVRMEVASHPNLPVKALVKLMQDESGNVKETACMRFEELDATVIHNSLKDKSAPLPTQWYLKLILAENLTSDSFEEQF